MNYPELIIAHSAFDKYEKRAEAYDFFQRTKEEHLWNQPTVPMSEINKLFKFIKRWDYHFRGEEQLFQKAYSEVYDEICYLKGKTFHSIDVLERNNHVCIQKIMNKFATINRVDRYESTDASKMAHAILPDVFVMWDRKIREGTIGDANSSHAESYVMRFLPHVKSELGELINSCRVDSDQSEKVLTAIESICNGDTIAKLLDEYNYMSYTMPTEFNLHKANFTEYYPEADMEAGLLDSIDFWNEYIAGKGSPEGLRDELLTMLDFLQKEKIITPSKRREFWVMFRNGSREDQIWVHNEVKTLYEEAMLS